MTDAATYRLYDASIIVSTPHSSKRGPRNQRLWGHLTKSNDWETFNRLMKVLEAAGFIVGEDPRIAEQFPLLNGSHRYGWRSTPHGNLEFKAEIFPVGCKVEFFQNVVISNRNGGRYDFDRVKKMPYLIRKLFEGTRAKLIAHLEGRGWADETREHSPVPESTIGQRLLSAEGLAQRPGPAEISSVALIRFNNTWDGEYERRRGLHRFERGSDGWPTRKERSTSYALLDGDKVEVQPGDLRYWRTRDGRLQRGLIFGGIGGQWIAVYGPGQNDYTYRSTYELFSWRPGLARRQHPKPVPLPKVLEQAVAAQQFERAIVLRDLIARQAQEQRDAA